MIDFDNLHGEIHLRRAISLGDNNDMARPRKVPIMAEDMKIEEVEQVAGDHVTYRPGPEDPPIVKWSGHTFHANVPKFVEHPELLEKARQNKFFKVGAFGPGDAVETREETGLPKTPEQYRAHAVAWLKTTQSVEELDQTWRKEETLRHDCGVGSDDIDLLNGLIDPLRAELRKRDLER